jgi:phosphoenolpyruvate carboxylase
MKSNQENNLFHFRYNPFYHFDFIKKFIENYKNILEKARKNEDILNRSVLKVH